MSPHSRIFRHSRYDAVPVAALFLCGALEIGLAARFDRLGWAWLAAGAVVLFIMRGVNGAAIHNGVHTPFFRSRLLNRLALFGHCVVAAGVPTSAYARGHFYHHRNTISFNDFRLQDSYGVRPMLALILTSALDPFNARNLALGIKLALTKEMPKPDMERRDFKSHGDYNGHIFKVVLWEIKNEPALFRQVLAEALGIVAFRALLCALSPRFFFFFFIPFLFCTSLFTIYDDYCQHYGTTGDDSRRNSASSYGWLYNLLWLNVGYHQEHHYRPGAHWTTLPALRREMPPEEERRVVPVWLMSNGLVPFKRPRAATTRDGVNVAQISCDGLPGVPSSRV